MNLKDYIILVGVATVLAYLKTTNGVYNSPAEHAGSFVAVWGFSMVVMIWLYRQIESKTLMKSLGLKSDNSVTEKILMKYTLIATLVVIFIIIVLSIIYLG